MKVLSNWRNIWNSIWIFAELSLNFLAKSAAIFTKRNKISRSILWKFMTWSDLSFSHLEPVYSYFLLKACPFTNETFYIYDIVWLGPKVRPTFPFKCGKCEKTYKLKSSLTQHLTFECGLEPSFTCSHCDYRAKRKGTLRAHLINAHCVNRSQFGAFGAAGNGILAFLFSHLYLNVIIFLVFYTASVVRPAQPFKCDRCGRSYVSKRSLKRHLNNECGVNPLSVIPL